MAGELVTYGRRVNLLLVEIADDLTRKDCEKLCFIYGDLFPASFKELHGENALMLLMKLRDQRVFSNDRPEMLANLMGDLQLLHLKSRVEDFIGEARNGYAISILKRPLPPVPTNVNIPTPVESNASPETQPCGRNETFNSQDEGSYTCFFQYPLRPSPGTQKRSIFRDSRSSTQDSSSSDDDIYSYCELRSISREHFPLHQERMKLLVKPVREAISAGTERVITSKELKCFLPRSSYILVINTGHRINNPYVSAKLIMLPGSQVERKYYLMAQLQLRQHSKKKKQYQDIYSHSSLLTNLPGSTPHPIQEGAAPIQEGAIPTQEGASLVLAGAQKEACVASFPSIISHEHFLSEDLVNRPYLTLVFTLLLYRKE